MPMSLLEVVRATAESNDFLDGKGKLKTLDSIGIIDFVIALERDARIVIPPASLREEHFRSLEAVVELVEQLEGS